MGIRLEPGTFAGALGVIGTGVALMFPDQRWIGGVIVVLGVLVFLLGIQIEGWHLESRPLWAFYRRRISLHEASRRLHEVMEVSGLDDTQGSASPLDRAKEVFLTLAQQGRCSLFGRRPPSRQWLMIPQEKIYGLHPFALSGENSIRSSSPALTAPVYDDVWLYEHDAKRVIQERINLHKHVAGSV